MAFLLSFMVVISLSLYSLPPATKFAQGYIFTGVCDSVNRGGVCLSACWDTPRSRHPPATEHAGRYGQRAGGTHPTGMQSC